MEKLEFRKYILTPFFRKNSSEYLVPRYKSTRGQPQIHPQGRKKGRKKKKGKVTLVTCYRFSLGVCSLRSPSFLVPPSASFLIENSSVSMEAEDEIVRTPRSLRLICLSELVSSSSCDYLLRLPLGADTTPRIAGNYRGARKWQQFSACTHLHSH